MTASNREMSMGIGYVLLATVGWSLSGLFVRLMPSLDGWQINCWRGFWMSCALAIYLILRHGHNLWPVISAVPLFATLASALCFATGTTVYVTSLTLTSTATVSVIGATSPLVTGLLSPWITQERPGVWAWLAAVIALCGMGVIAWNGFGQGTMTGMLLSFGIPLTFAGQTLMLRRYRAFDMMPSICLGGMISFAIAGGAGFLFGHHQSALDVNPHDFGLLMLMGPLQLAAPLVLYGMGARLVSAFTLSLIAMLDAVINPFWPWFFRGEVPGALEVIGGMVILMAVVIYVVGSHFEKPVHA
ncbi:MAG: DMT family transporter [Aestuariivirga sp.]